MTLGPTAGPALYNQDFTLASGDDSSGIVSNAPINVSSQETVFLTFALLGGATNIGSLLDDVSITTAPTANDVAKGGTALAGAFSYLSGPRFNLRRGKVTPYAQVLFRGLVATAGIGHSGITNAFAMTVVSIRPMQAEYYLTKFSDGLNNRQNNFRLSSGVVFRFGRTT